MKISDLNQYLNRLSLTTKLFFSYLVVITMVSGVIALFTRWVLISSLTDELKLRGLGIAHSLADSSRAYILTKKNPELTSLVFNARLGARRDLVNYIFAADKEGNVIAHTFIRPFPEGLEKRNQLNPQQIESIRLLKIEEASVYDVAVSISEGIYRIGTIHVGLNKLHIDELIAKLRITFLGFLSLMTILFFGISHLLARYITQPISELTRISDEIARGDAAIKPYFVETGFKCWQIKNCRHTDCPGYDQTDLPCWYLDGTRGCESGKGKFPEKLEACRSCEVYQKHMGDEVARLAYSFTNMTMRLKLKETELKTSERNYRLLVDNLPNIVFKGFADGAIDFFDDKVTRLTGYPKEEFNERRMTWFDIIYPPDLESAQEVFKNALKGNKSYVREYRMQTYEGEPVWIEEGSQIICDAQGRIEYISGAFLNINERKTAEAALYLSEEKYRSLFDSGPAPIFVLNCKSLEILDANPAARETYGYTKEELIGKPFSEIGPTGFDDCTEIFKSCKSGYRFSKVSQKLKHFRKGFIPFYVRINACPVHYKDRAAIILAATDITEIVEKDAQLMQASKMTMLGEMSAGIAHELNQPLNAIYLGNEYLKVMVENEQEIPPGDLYKVVQEVNDQVERASDIINRLREFGRKPDYEKEIIDINRPIEGTIKILRHQLTLMDIELEVKLAAGLPPILAQNNPLEQVFFNLVTNARDAILIKNNFHGERRKIIVRTFASQGNIVASVEDTGVGIPKDLQEKIFEPFFTTKDAGKGMGLGLSISYGIIRDYEGEIEIYSRPGLGTTIKIVFPAYRQGVA